MPDDDPVVLPLDDLPDDDPALSLLDLPEPDVLFDEDEGDEVLAGDFSALLPEPVSIAMLVSYGVTVTVPIAPVALSDPTHISSSRTTVSTPALENTMPGTRP